LRELPECDTPEQMYSKAKVQSVVSKLC